MCHFFVYAIYSCSLLCPLTDKYWHEKNLICGLCNNCWACCPACQKLYHFKLCMNVQARQLIKKSLIELYKLHAFRITCNKSALSLLKSWEWHYVSDQQQLPINMPLSFFQSPWFFLSGDKLKNNFCQVANKKSLALYICKLKLCMFVTDVNFVHWNIHAGHYMFWFSHVLKGDNFIFMTKTMGFSVL